MSAESAENKVLIVGAGPGGLALAQILRGQGVPFEIFERDPTLTSRKQGWAVALVECLPDLLELLPADLGDLAQVSVNYGIHAYDSLGVTNAVTGEILARMGSVPRGEPGYVIRANREHFRQYLLKKMDGHIQLGKNISHYTQDRSGVTAFFDDGTSARGALLIGADGSHSHIRKQLLGAEGAANMPSKMIPMISENILTKAEYLPYHEIGSSAILANTDGLKVLIGLLEALDGGERARYYTAICYESADPVGDGAWATHASKQELYDKAMAVIQEKNVVPMVIDNLRNAGPESMSSPGIKFEEFVPPSAFPRGRVTLLGDALHTMIPFRGAGANTAVRDACELGRLLADETKRARNEGGLADVHWVLQEYEKAALPRGEEMVLTSRAAGSSMLGPMEGRRNTYVAPH